MTTKRDYVAEILEKRSRLKKRSQAQEQFRARLIPVVAGFRALKELGDGEKYRNEFLKYGPIGYVACVEGYFRLIVADLINSGSPYLEAASKFDEIKISLSSVVAIQSKSITLGEYISHMVPLNSLADIDRCFSVLLDCDFIFEIKKFNISKTPDQKPLTIEEVSPAIFKNVKEIFRLRNIYAHELATSEPLKPKRIEECIGAIALFVITVEEYLNYKERA